MSVAAVLILILAIHCPDGASHAALTQSEIPADEYAVFDAVITNMFADNKVTFDFGGEVTVKLLMVVDHTVAYPFSTVSSRSQTGITEDWRANFPGIVQQTVDEYSAKNQQPSVLKRLFHLSVDYVLVSAEKEAKRRETARYDNQWHAGDGRVSLSRVGFDRDHRQALVYMSFYCGALCGHGFFLFLTKTGSEWRVDKKFQVWIS